MGRQKISSAQQQQQQQQQQRLESRPKRKATNAHIFRYLQTRNPSRLEENDLRRALEASLEECPDFWPEDSASCSSSDQSNATSASSNSSTGGGCNINSCKNQRSRKLGPTKRRSTKSSSMQLNHLNNCNYHSHHHNHQYHLHHHHPSNLHANSLCTANHPNQCCPMSSVHNRYKPVAKKNIYDEADFFHDGIMEYIEFELMRKSIIQGKLKKLE